MSWKSQIRFTTLVTAAALLLTGFVLGASAFGNIGAQQQIPETLATTEQWYADLYERVSPSVVALTVTREWSEIHDFEEEFDEDVLVTGSGFVIDNEGYIITNFHVAQGATEVVAEFRDGTIARAEIVGLDPSSDIAVVKVDLPADRLHPVVFGDIDEVFVGQIVVAIGSPFENDWTMTTGIVSAIGRAIPSLSQYNIGAAIQTDAPINPGNSGGPLLNLHGEVIGVNAQIASEVRANSGVGFAIPADLVQRVAKDLIQHGEVAYSVIGISGSEVNLQVIEALNLSNNQQGVVIFEAATNSPAEAAGLLDMEFDRNDNLIAADIIVAINGEPVIDVGSILTYLARYTRPGDVVDITVLRDGEEIVLPLTLGQR